MHRLTVCKEIAFYFTIPSDFASIGLEVFNSTYIFINNTLVLKYVNRDVNMSIWKGFLFNKLSLLVFCANRCFRAIHSIFYVGHCIDFMDLHYSEILYSQRHSLCMIIYRAMHLIRVVESVILLFTLLTIRVHLASSVYLNIKYWRN